jgi:peptidyl-prolyl cis-trans isomerase D
MIYIFRKEMKKWHTVLWLVFASLALSGLAAIIWRRPHESEIKVAEVNGRDVLFKKYRSALSEIRLQIEAYQAYAKAYGVSVDLFLNMAGLGNPEEAAFNKCVRDSLIDQERGLFNIQFSSKSFDEELVKMLPPQVKNPVGDVDMEAYRFYVNRLCTTITEFEDNQEEEFKRDLFEKFIKSSYYTPVGKAREAFVSDQAKKKFAILTFPFDRYLDEVKKLSPTDEEIEKFFKKNKESYRIPEKRKAEYWMLSSSDYAEKMEIDEQAILRFYDKNKSSLFRIPPKVKVRHILLKIEKDEAPEKVTEILEKAKDLHKQLIENTDKFAEFAKKYSQDSKTASKGGLTDFFERGTFDADFEKTAFKLKEVGGISDIIKTTDGYEIIQLIERVSASEKPLDVVRDDIVKTIKAKKSVTSLKGDIERVLHEAKKDVDAIDRFVVKNGLATKTSAWLGQKDTAGYELKNKLAEKLFATRKKQSVQGSFVDEEKHVLYRLTDIQESFIPKFDEIKNDVVDDYFQDKAETEIKATVKKARREFFDKKATLADLSSTLNLKLIETDLVKKDDKIDEFKDIPNLKAKAFALTDKAQLLKHEHKSDYNLIQMTKMEEVEMDEFATVRDKTLKDVKERNINPYLGAFIASLQRNAKIEKSEKLQGTQEQSE